MSPAQRPALTDPAAQPPPATVHGVVQDAITRARAAEEVLSGAFARGEVGFFVPTGTVGPLLAGLASLLAEADWLVAGPREWTAALGRGVPLAAVFHQARGDAEDGQLGRSQPLHWGDRPHKVLPCGGPLGARITHAAGLGQAAAIAGDRAATLCLFGEGTANESDFHVGLNFAAVFRAHVVYVVHAARVPGPFRTTETLAEKAEAYGLPSVRVDGDDLPLVIATVQDALERARSGAGPTLVEVLAPSERAEPELPGTAEARWAARTTWEECMRSPRPPKETLTRDLWAVPPAGPGA